MKKKKRQLKRVRTARDVDALLRYSVARRFRMYRQRHQLTEEQLAEKMERGMTQKTVKAIDTYSHSITVVDIILMSYFF